MICDSRQNSDSQGFDFGVSLFNFWFHYSEPVRFFQIRSIPCCRQRGQVLKSCPSGGSLISNRKEGAGLVLRGRRLRSFLSATRNEDRLLRNQPGSGTLHRPIHRAARGKLAGLTGMVLPLNYIHKPVSTWERLDIPPHRKYRPAPLSCTSSSSGRSSARRIENEVFESRGEIQENDA